MRVFFLIGCFFVLLSSSAASFDTQHNPISRDLPPEPPPGPTDWVVSLIDQAEVSPGQKNYLFRGNLPLLTDTEYNYDGLVEILKEKVNLTGEFYVVEIDFTWEFWPDVSTWIDTSANFWANNTDLGAFIWWPLYGDLIDPNILPESELEYYASSLASWQTDQLVEKMNNVSSMLHTQYDKQRIIYFHCHTGVDRTGEFAISYELAFLNSTFQDAITYSDDLCNKVNGRDIMPIMVWAAEWYCYYLNFTQGKQLSCEVPE